MSTPPVDLICQSIDLDGEKLLWVDGVTMDTPLLLPLAAVAECIQYRGTFREFLMSNMMIAGQVLGASNGQHSPTVVARAVQLMAREKSLSAQDALHLVMEEALDLLDADNGDAEIFFRNYQAEAGASATA